MVARETAKMSTCRLGESCEWQWFVVPVSRINLRALWSGTYAGLEERPDGKGIGWCSNLGGTRFW